MDLSKCSQTMNCCWNLLGNSKVQVVVTRGSTLLLSVPCILYVCCVVKGSLGSSLSKQVFEMQAIVAPISNRDTVWLLLTLTRKLAAYLLSLSLTSIVLFWMQLELSILELSGISSDSVAMCWGVQVLEVILFTWCCEWALLLWLSVWGVFALFWW